MANRAVVVRLKAEIADYQAKLRSASQSTKDFAKAGTESATKNKADWDKIGNGAMLAGAAIGAGLGLAVKKFSDFDAAMSAAAAGTMATTSQLAALREAAIEAGASTQYSATEAAQAITEMGKAGVSTRDILGGGLAGALDLAAAGQLEVGQAAEIAATALTQFNLEGDKLPHVADLYAAAAGKAQGSVQDIAGAMKYAGVTAASMGVSLEETTGVMGMFASKGIIGEQAGTTFRSMLMSLTAPSEKAAGVMEDLGINVYDVNGKFVGMEGAAKILHDRLGPLDEATRNAAMGTIFGNEAMGGAIALYQGGGEAVADWTNKVNDAGYAQKQAALLTDNLKGDVERLGGAFDTALIQSGSGANDMLRTLTKSITGLIDGFNGLPAAQQKTIVGAAGAAAGLLLVGGGAIKATTSILEMKKALEGAGIASGKFGSAAGKAGKAAGILAAGLIAFAQADRLFGNSKADVSVNRLAKELGKTDDALKVVNESFGKATDFSGRADSGIRDFGDALSATFEPGKMQRVDDFLGGMKEAFGGTNYSDISTAAERLGAVDEALAKMAGSGNADAAKEAFAQISREAARQGIATDDLREKFPAYVAALESAESQASDTEAALSPLTDQTYDAAKAAQDAADGTKAFADELDAINSPALDARDAARKVEEAVNGATKAFKDNGKTLDIHKEKGRANQEAIDAVASAMLDEIGTMQANGASQVALQGKLDASRARLQKVAEKFYGSKAAAKAYVDQVLKTPAAVSTTITARTADAKKAVSDLQRRINALRGNDVRINVRYVESGPRPTGGRSTAGGITKDNADGGFYNNRGGLVKAFSDGGFASTIGAQQPQIQANQGPGGIMWAETGAGPWEAFISGHPGKKQRSVSILSETAARLGYDVVKRFADGGLLASMQPVPRQYATATGGGGRPGVSIGEINAYGTDAQQAMRRAVDELEYRVVSGL